MSITYTITTNFGAKDSLPSGDAGKIIKGSEFTTEFNAIKAALALASPAASPTFTGTVTAANVTCPGTINFTGGTVSNLGSVTTADINGGTVDNVVIGGATAAAGSFTTVNASGTITGNVTGDLTGNVTGNVTGDIDVSAGTLTLADDQVSGDKIDGGTISNFTSTGIDDNASATAIAIASTGTVSFNAGIEEQVFDMDSGAGTTSIDPDNGTVQYKTVSTPTTLTETLSAGEYVILMIDVASSSDITWPATTWVGGTAPALETSGYNIIALWKVGSILYGVTSGAA